MKRLALAAAIVGLGVLTGCTTLHENRRTLTTWNLELIKDTARIGPPPQSGFGKADRVAHQIINCVFVEPLACVMLPASWLADTVVLNPINGFQKAELQTHARRFGRDDERGVAESEHKSFAAVWWVSDVLAVPEFSARWLWNSVVPTDPVNKESWNKYWDQHNEHTTQ